MSIVSYCFMRKRHVWVYQHILLSFTSVCIPFITPPFPSSFLIIHPPLHLVCLSAWPRQSRPPILSISPLSLHLACFLSLLSICSAVRSWVAFNELFDERLSLAGWRHWRGGMGGGSLESFRNKKRSITWFLYLPESFFPSFFALLSFPIFTPSLRCASG